MFNVQTIQSALQAYPEMHGWIFTNFSHRDPLTDSLLSLNTDVISTRRWVYIVPKTGEPIKIVHAIENTILKDLPGETIQYSGQKQLISFLHKCSQKTYAILADSNISVISTVDAGFVQLLHECSIKTTSASPLVQITKGLLTKTGVESHERASSLLYKIIFETWDFISSKYKVEADLSEHEVLTFILDKFKAYSLVYHHEPIVAFGKNTGNPHYSVPKINSAIAKKGDIIQLDIFAKEAYAKNENGDITSEAGVYADISWVGVYDTAVDEHYMNTFKTLCNSRDIVYSTLENATKNDELFSVTGSTLDDKVRQILISANFEHAIKHRTGHGIDTSCHGSGVNLDSVEFPDKRTLLNGSCFSVEPGLYFDAFGMRTEIDIYIQDGKPVISGKRYQIDCVLDIPQKEILHIIQT